MSDIIDNGSFLITEEHGSIPLLGHELKYRMSANEVDYKVLVEFCQENDLNAAVVPAPRSGGVAFALATNILGTRSKTTVEDESWDGGTCSESWSVRTLKKCNEYVLIRERMGQRNGKRDLEQSKLYRLVYVEGDNDITAGEWLRRFMLHSQGIDSQMVGVSATVEYLQDYHNGNTVGTSGSDSGQPIWEPVGPANDVTLRRRVRIEPFDEDEGILDEDQQMDFLNRVSARFVSLCKTVDEILMRASMKKLLSRHNAIPDPTVKGGVVQIVNEKTPEELGEDRLQPHLETLVPFAKLLRFWGNTNRPDPTAEDAVWSGEKGKVDYRTKGNLRLTPLVKTETLLEEIAQNVEHSLNQQFGELYEAIRQVLTELNENALESGEKGSAKRKEQLIARANAFQKKAESLNDAVKEWEEQLDRDLTVRVTPYKDQMDEMDARLAAIKPVDQETAEVFLKLVKKEVDKPKKGFEALGSLFG